MIGLKIRSPLSISWADAEYGLITVACSTVTVTKCQAALKTLQAFEFFKPTCLCREPHVDPECNSFRDFLFDHPCIYVVKKGESLHPIYPSPSTEINSRDVYFQLNFVFFGKKPDELCASGNQDSTPEYSIELI